MAQFSLAKFVQPGYNYTTLYLPLILNSPLISVLIAVAYERPKFDIVFNGRGQLVGDMAVTP